MASYDRDRRVGPYSTMVSFQNYPSAVPDAPVPTMPIDLNVRETGVFFTWDLAARALRHRLEIVSDLDNQVFVDAEIGLTTNDPATGGCANRPLTFAFVGPFHNDGRTYRWRVRASNPRGPGPYSSWMRFKNGPAGPPEPPVLLSPPDGAHLSDRTANLTWGQTLGGFDYILEVARDAGFQDLLNPQQTAIPRDLSSPTRSMPRTLLPEEGRRFFWRVLARNELETYSDPRVFWNDRGERCSQPKIAQGVNVSNVFLDHVDSCYDEVEERFLLIDKARRLTRNPHGHNGRMRETEGLSAESRDVMGIQTRDWRVAQTTMSIFQSMWRDSDNTWGTGGDRTQQSALSAHHHAELVYDFLLRVRGRNGPDGEGLSIVSVTEQATTGVGLDCPFRDNAAFGFNSVGYGVEGPRGWRMAGSLDIAAHEWGHALTSHFSKLPYSGEPGALDEAFSDWMAVAVSDYYDRGNLWTIGEGASASELVAIRNLENPHDPGDLNRPQPDTYLDDPYWFPRQGEPVAACTPTQTSCDPYPIGNNDNCGVHINSGVPNKAFFLMAAPGTRSHNGVTVSGIGIQKAFRIAYDANSRYWSKARTFEDAAGGMIRSAEQSFGAGSFEEQQVRRAWQAVRVPVNSLPDPQPTPTAPPCPGDCNHDGIVAVSELVQAVNMALGTSPVSQCPEMDLNGDREITVNELIVLVNYALNGCGAAGVGGGADTQIAYVQVWGSSGYRGEAVTISVVVKNGGGRVAGLNLDIDYPSTVISAPVCKKDPRLNQGQIAASSDLASGVSGIGRKRIVLFHDDYPPPTFSDGVTVICEASILSGASAGSHPLSAARLTVADAYGNIVPSAFSSVGSITVLSAGGSSGGCAIAHPRATRDMGLVIVLMPALLYMLRRRVASRLLIALILVVCGAPSSGQDGRAFSGTWSLVVRGEPEARVFASARGREASELRLAERFRGPGVVTDEPHGTRRWVIREIRRNGSAWEAELIVIGSTSVSVGKISATLWGDDIEGEITDVDGESLASITGRVVFSGGQGRIVRASGRFEAANGEQGQWSWIPAPQGK